tara:strand:- start:139 stop:324 length:186 start_codon:yes stop_codon:yes gene_type:complete
MRGTAKTAQHGYRSPESHPGRVLFFQARYLVITPYHPGRVLFFQVRYLVITPYHPGRVLVF